MSTLSDARDDPADRAYALLDALADDHAWDDDYDADECDGCDGACDPPDRDRFLELGHPPTLEEIGLWELYKASRRRPEC